MKKLIHSLIATSFCILLISCGDDDGTTTTFTLEGTTWESTSYVSTGCDDPNDNENSQGFTCTASDCETLQLQNGTVTIINTEEGVSETTLATYTLSGNTLTITLDDNGSAVTFDISYVIVNDVLTLTFTFPLDGCDVVQTYAARS